MKEKVVFLSEKDYVIKNYEGGFGFKNKFNLFLNGFDKVGSNLLSLFFLYIIWLAFFGFLMTYVESFVVQNWYSGFNTDEILNVNNLKDLTVVFLIFLGIMLNYNAMQLFCVNSIMKVENRIEENVVLYSLKKMTLLLKTSIIPAFIFYLSYIISALLFFNVDNEFFTLKNVLIIFTIFSLLAINYISFLATSVIYMSESLYPFEDNIFKRFYKAYRKSIKMFNSIFITLMGNMIVVMCLLFFVMILIALGVDLFKEFFISAEIITQWKVKYNLSEELLNQFVQLLIFFYSLPFIGMIIFILNRARLRSILFLFLITEDMEEYKYRLIKPVKIVEENN